MLVEKFNYQEYNSKTDRSSIKGVKLPSVTKILSATKSEETKAGLKEWRERVGEVEAERILRKAIGIGDCLHDNLEHFIKSSRPPEGPILIKMMSEVIIEQGLKNVDEFWGLEVPLYSKDLYAGRTDFICVHNGIPCIGDFKNSRKLKKFEYLDDYRCQLAAYILSHNEMFGTNIQKGIIMIVTRDCEYQELVIDGKLFDESVTWWLTRLESYLNNI